MRYLRNNMKQYFQTLILLLALFMQTVSAQSVANPKVTYFHNDITGTAVAATDEKGEVIWREQRRAYGEVKVDPLKPRSLDEFSVGYTGHQADKESGLTYAKARYYNKAIGRFYAPDPIPFRESDLVSINRYAYAANNPYKFFDPMGTDKWLITQKYDNTISDAEATVVAGAIGIVLPPVAALQEYNEDGLNAGMAVDAIPYLKLAKPVLDKVKAIAKTATKHADDTTETFYRVMSPEHFDELASKGRLRGTSETCISECSKYVDMYAGVKVEFKVNSGTKAKLAEIGGIHRNNKKLQLIYPKMPKLTKNWAETGTMFKYEKGQISIGLGKDNGKGLQIFNDNIKSFKEIKK